MNFWLNELQALNIRDTLSNMKGTAFKLYRGYKWIVVDKRVLGGSPTIKGTRLSVELVLNCLAAGMTAEDINKDYGHFPKECVPEVLKFAAELSRKFENVAA